MRGGSGILLATGKDSVSENGTRAIVRELYDAYGRRDFERVAALIHADIDWVIYAPMPVFPFAGPRHGRTAVLAAMAEIAVSFSLESYNPQVTIIEGARGVDVGRRLPAARHRPGVAPADCRLHASSRTAAWSSTASSSTASTRSNRRSGANCSSDGVLAANRAGR